ncbi:MAG: hypothetical protein ABSF14_20320 [Terriglobia bacterium]
MSIDPVFDFENSVVKVTPQASWGRLSRMSERDYIYELNEIKDQVDRHVDGDAELVVSYECGICEEHGLSYHRALAHCANGELPDE